MGNKLFSHLPCRKYVLEPNTRKAPPASQTNHSLGHLQCPISPHNGPNYFLPFPSFFSFQPISQIFHFSRGLKLILTKLTLRASTPCSNSQSYICSVFNDIYSLIYSAYIRPNTNKTISLGEESQTLRLLTKESVVRIPGAARERELPIQNKILQWWTR